MYNNNPFLKQSTNNTYFVLTKHSDTKPKLKIRASTHGKTSIYVFTMIEPRLHSTKNIPFARTKYYDTKSKQNIRAPTCGKISTVLTYVRTYEYICNVTRAKVKNGLKTKPRAPHQRVYSREVVRQSVEPDVHNVLLIETHGNGDAWPRTRRKQKVDINYREKKSNARLFLCPGPFRRMDNAIIKNTFPYKRAFEKKVPKTGKLLPWYMWDGSP